MPASAHDVELACVLREILQSGQPVPAEAFNAQGVVDLALLGELAGAVHPHPPALVFEK